MAKDKSKATGRESVWQAIRSLRTFTRAQLFEAANASRDCIKKYIRGLVCAGYLVEEETGDNHLTANLIRLVNDPGPTPPRVRQDGTRVVRGNGREQMWRTMRILGEFSCRDIAIQGSTEDCLLSYSSVRSYVSILHRAGYLALSPTGRWRMVMARYSGPLPPMVINCGRHLYDQNTQQIVWSKEASHDQ